MAAATEVRVKIAEIKEGWCKNFTPSNEMEERFKHKVEEALENVKKDFTVKNWVPIDLEHSKTWESHIEVLKSLGLQFISPYEWCLTWAQMVAEGYDVIAFYFGMEHRTSQKPKVNVDLGLDVSRPVSWITLVDTLRETP